MKQKYIIEFKTGSLKYETYLLVSIFEFYFSATKRNRKDARINVSERSAIFHKYTRFTRSIRI